MVANISVAGVTTFFQDLSILIRMSRANKEYADIHREESVTSDPKHEQALNDALREVESLLKRTATLVQLVPSAHIDAAAERLRYWSKGEKKDWDGLFHRVCALRNAAHTELKEYQFYAYPKDKGQKLMSFNADWAGILAAFPSALSDAYSATDCWALRHPTASVFHSMRVAEIGLRAIARERRLRLPKNKVVEWATWQEVIGALDAEIRRIGTQMKAGKAKDAALAFYSGARADLNGFKDDYRNSVMHVRNDYDDLQAQRALLLVHAFMERLATRLDENRQRINWGKRV